MIDTTKTMTGHDRFTQVPNIVFRMYPLLDKFTVETSGLYAYLLSWRYDRKGDEKNPMWHHVWLTKEAMQAQTGLKRHKLDKHLGILKEYGLIVEKLSKVVRNKKNYLVLDPLTEAEFRAKYPEAIRKFEEKLGIAEERTQEFRERMAEAQALNGGMSDEEIDAYL